MLLLIATYRSVLPSSFAKNRDSWERVAFGAGEAVWERGLVTKGLGICHGITGNAWPLLLLGDDQRISRALAMMVHAIDIPPMGSAPYRTPDNPYSLFEGLAGAVCAWADACAVITARLDLAKGNSLALGMPGLGGGGAVSML